MQLNSNSRNDCLSDLHHPLTENHDSLSTNGSQAFGLSKIYETTGTDLITETSEVVLICKKDYDKTIYGLTLQTWPKKSFRAASLFSRYPRKTLFPFTPIL